MAPPRCAKLWLKPALSGGGGEVGPWFAPNITSDGGGPTEVLLENVATMIPPLDAGGLVPFTVTMDTWTEWAAAPVNKNAFSYTTGASITSNAN